MTFKILAPSLPPLRRARIWCHFQLNRPLETWKREEITNRLTLLQKALKVGHTSRLSRGEMSIRIRVQYVSGFLRHLSEHRKLVHLNLHLLLYELLGSDRLVLVRQIFQSSVYLMHVFAYSEQHVLRGEPDARHVQYGGSFVRAAFTQHCHHSLMCERVHKGVGRLARRGLSGRRGERLLEES